ncbi:MAG: glucose 1-dehydrogenase [Proteobacteria bacterium]|nr:glucose 1-dehydrogenase [Pseudomonadota bacterium]
MRLKDSVVIITGGAQGIGRAYALGMAEEGAKLVVADVNVEAADVTVRDIQAKGREALALQTDVSSPESTHNMAKRTVENFGRIDVLVNNAAIFGKIRISRMPFYELDLDEWDRVIAVNLKGTLLCCRAVFPQMKTQGGGKIINIATTGFFFGNPNYVHYVASKAGIIGLTRAMAREVGDYNINVNCIAPGATLAEDPGDKVTWNRRVKRFNEVLLPKRCLKRIQYPEDLVGAVIFLASSDSNLITGQTIVVDGGDIMH